MAESSALTADDVRTHADAANRVLSEMQRVVLGQHAVLRESLLALLARGHVLLEGPPGTAKTLLVRSLNRALGLEFRRIQFTPDLMPSDITGVSILGGSGTTFTFRPGPLFADLVLADEINRAPAKTQAALLEAMEERSATVDGTSHPMSASFTVFATQNPIEFEGTYPLPEAELDRFLIKSKLTWPDAAVEESVLARVLGGFESSDVETFGITQVLDANGLAGLRAAVRRVRVEPTLTAYITSLVRATRDAPALTLGASPRASVALLKLAQAAALIDGRDFVVPDDVKSLAAPVLRHRVIVAPELELEGVSADDALATLIQRRSRHRGRDRSVETVVCRRRDACSDRARHACVAGGSERPLCGRHHLGDGAHRRRDPHRCARPHRVSGDPRGTTGVLGWSAAAGDVSMEECDPPAASHSGA